MPAELILIDLMLADNQPTINQFVRSNAHWMFGVARRYVSDDGLAEDCVQESFACVFASLGRFERRSSLRSWMHRIVANVALMKLRKLKRNREVSLDLILPSFDCDAARADDDWADQTTPHDALEQSEAKNAINLAIGQLPETYRRILVMRDLEEQTTEDVAATLGLTDANVKVRLHRARRALKDIIDSNTNACGRAN